VEVKFCDSTPYQVPEFHVPSILLVVPTGSRMDGRACFETLAIERLSDSEGNRLSWETILTVKLSKFKHQTRLEHSRLLQKDNLCRLGAVPKRKKIYEVTEYTSL
jgi:hypothetical protein